MFIISKKGTVRNKQYIELDEVTQYVFALVTEKDGRLTSIDCHAWGDVAQELNRTLSEGCVARVTLDQHRSSPAQFHNSRRVYSAELLAMPSPDDMPPEVEPRRVTTAWGLWRPGGGWFRNLKPSNNFERDKSIIFVKDYENAKHFNVFEDCKDQQAVLVAAFGCHTVIKAIKSK